MAQSNSQTVIGVFETKEQATRAADHLRTEGYDRDTIDVSAHGADLKDVDHDRTESFFTNLLDKDTHAVNYREAARRGTVVTVHTTEMKRAERAAAILDEHGAVNVADPAYTGSGQGTTSGITGTGTGAATTDRLDNSDKSIPVIEERMQVGKREVETGGAHVRSRIVERPVEEKLRLREEHVNINRQPVDRPASKRDLDTFKEGEARFVEHAEKPIISKEARVVEEVRIGKETTEHTETIRDSVRKTDVEVDKIDPDKDANRKR